MAGARGSSRHSICPLHPRPDLLAPHWRPASAGSVSELSQSRLTSIQHFMVGLIRKVLETIVARFFTVAGRHNLYSPGDYFFPAISPVLHESSSAWGFVKEHDLVPARQSSTEAESHFV